jgi:hypothetical protein
VRAYVCTVVPVGVAMRTAVGLSSRTFGGVSVPASPWKTGTTKHRAVVELRLRYREEVCARVGVVRMEDVAGEDDRVLRQADLREVEEVAGGGEYVEPRGTGRTAPSAG